MSHDVEILIFTSKRARLLGQYQIETPLQATEVLLCHSLAIDGSLFSFPLSRSPNGPTVVCGRDSYSTNFASL